MATKWTGTYTPITNVNNGNEFGDGDVITTEMANVPINNAEYAVQTANEAKTIAEQAYNQSKSEPNVLYEDLQGLGVSNYKLSESGLYHVEFYDTFNSRDDLISGEITFYYDTNRVGYLSINNQYMFSNGNTIRVSIDTTGTFELLNQSNVVKKIIKITKII